ncbi:hypothetical protein DD238_002973 [Peronospora effusa]|uniref:M96 mating-specific protein family n=1 Tax=Peronospora effusa TaxID=542832 RepID=A0A3M6VN62_9STRA|nr:hypothetical protein DD238_002973 [Peronospora effusa]
MAFVLEDEDAQAFQAALSFVDECVLVDEEEMKDAVALKPTVMMQYEEDEWTWKSAIDITGVETSFEACGTSSTVSAIATQKKTHEMRAASQTVSRRRTEMKERKKLLRKAGIYGDTNWMSKDSRLEIAYLHERIEKLQLDLQVLQSRKSSKKATSAQVAAQEPTDAMDSARQIPKVWGEIAGRQQRRLKETERENARLRLAVQQQQKAATCMRNLVRKRAGYLTSDCSSFMDFGCANQIFVQLLASRRGGAGDFPLLFRHLETARQEVDAVFTSNGLANMVLTPSDVHLREGVDGKYLEAFSNKVLPFALRAATEATWGHFKGGEKHLGNGNIYEKTAKSDDPYTIIEEFTKEMHSKNARADIKVQQVVRRYMEPDRDIIIWVSMAEPVEIKHKMLHGLTYHLRGYAMTKRSSASTPENEVSQLQCVSLISLEPKAEVRYGPETVRAVTNFLIVTAAQKMQAHQDCIENALVDKQLGRRGVTTTEMAFLEDDDAMRAFEAALSYVEQYSIDTSMFTVSPSTSGASSTTFMSSLASASVDDIELLSPSVTPLASTFTDINESIEDASDTTMTSPSSPVFQLSNEAPTRLEQGLPTSGQTRKLGIRGRKKTIGRKMPVTRGDPNRARNERKIELAYLREKVKQMELELRALKLHPRAKPRAIRHNSKKLEKGSTKQETNAGSTVSRYDSVQIPTVWREVACRQRRRREKAERENVRLKLILENQIKMAKGLESLLQKRANKQVVECSSLSQTKKSKYSQGRTLDFRADVNDFKDLLAHLDRAYREVDTVFAANGLATMETTHRDARMREGADYMYLDIYANKVMPFGMRATAKAVWDHFKGAEKHRGNMYEGKVARHLATPDTPDTIIEDFAKEFFADNARADFHAKQVLRRYVEEDREIVIWVSSVVPLEFDDQRVKGLGFRHQGYALTKKAKVSAPYREFSLLQLCSLVSPEKEDHTVYDPAAVRALTDFMLGTVAGNITASQELIENVLMDQVSVDSVWTCCFWMMKRYGYNIDGMSV